MTDAATLETPQDAGQGKAGVVKRWLMAIQLAEKQEKTWRKTGEQVVQRYRQEGDDYDTFARSAGSKFNILWSNTEVMRPALYHSTPKPDVRRRYRDEDPAGKEAATILERGLSFSVDSYDFDQVMNLAVLDLLLPGRAVTRVRYEPTIGPVTDDTTGQPVMGEDGKTPLERITYQAVTCEHVAWKDFRRGPGRTWAEVEWVAFKHCLTLEQLEKINADLAKDVSLDVTETDDEGEKDDDSELFKRGVVWEVWDRQTREVLFIAPSLDTQPLKQTKDKLGLEGFYPIPRPMYALESSDNLVPVELFRLYKDQADELDRVTQRINAIVKACKVRGIYDSTLEVLNDVMKAGDNEFKPTKDSAIALMAQGGDFNKAIWMFPVEKLAVVLRELYLSRDQIKATIYEITGLSDIVRGATDPNETLGAQQLKAQSGSRRLRRLQKEVQRYARDLMRLKAEIMAEHFEPFMLSMMTGKQVTPEVHKILKSDLTRSYRIDIETDSTIAEDEQRDQKAMTDLLDGVTRYVAAVGPVVQTGYMPANAAVSLLKSIVRRFRLGGEVEDALDDAQGKIEESNGQMPPSPEEKAAQAEQAARQQEMQMKQQAQQADLAAQGQKLQMEMAAAQAEEARKQQAFEAEQRRLDQAAIQASDRARYELDQKIAMQRDLTAAQVEAARAKAKAQPKEKKAA